VLMSSFKVRGCSGNFDVEKDFKVPISWFWSLHISKV
jgi:hypothetical protein